MELLVELLVNWVLMMMRRTNEVMEGDFITIQGGMTLFVTWQEPVPSSCWKVPAIGFTSW